MGQRRFFLLPILLAAILLCGCSRHASNQLSDFADKLFIQEISSDSLTLNYTVSSPENYAIKQLPSGFPSFKYSDLEQNSAVYENQLSKLEACKNDHFSISDQVLYDVLRDHFETELASSKYTVFFRVFSPTTGIQAQLPVLLSEFRFQDKNDVEQYLALLHTLPSYFQSLLDVETENQNRSHGLSKGSIQRIRSQCEEFLNGHGETILTSSFENATKNMNFLTIEEKMKYQNQMQSAINDQVLPAYQSLIEQLNILEKTAVSQGNLCHYPQGKAYYQQLVQESTGASRPLAQLVTDMQQRLTTAQHRLSTYAKENPSLFSRCQRYTTFFHQPEEILTHLEKEMKKDFPSLAPSNGRSFEHHIEYIPSSLENYLSPAFYLIPPIDDICQNVIYLNPAYTNSSSLFTTLAHEGYPGHLYQTCYFSSQNPHPIRQLLSYPGYAEGYGTYAEIYSYQYTGLSTEEIDLLQQNQIMSLCIYGLCDVGIHYDGWNIPELTKFLSTYGIKQKESIQNLYENIIDEPTNYLRYTCGYLEILHVKDSMKKNLGTSYNECDFHQYLLSVGPASFSIIEKYLPDYKSFFSSKN